MTRNQLARAAARAKRITDSWPEWKRGILGTSLRSTNDYARPSVINDGTTEERALRREVVELRSLLEALAKDLKNLKYADDSEDVVNQWVERLEEYL